MRQKYLIIHDAAKHNLKIREYAVIDKSLEKTHTSMLRHDDYCLLYEENYDSAIIVNSISNGMSDLVATLRTRNLFPVAPKADLIAQSVISLYDSAKNSSVELFFNDSDRNANLR
ncbi:MAG: hypothetical protein C4518_13350 [Desulfobacteraceae bacterium]|nr:MAG: hypothetical protein C4518_13350 [Desulfobacteraceae bacterium]